MEKSSQLNTLFLQQMEELELFRQARISEQAAPALTQNGDALRLLTEALGFFSARSRKESQDGADRIHYRLFQQIYPYLLSPVPAAAMLRARTNGIFTEKSHLPAGSQVVVETRDGEPVYFRTLEDLTILPVRLTGTKVSFLPREGFRLFIRLESDMIRNDEPGTLRFRLNCLGDFQNSLFFRHLLESHLTGAHVSYEASPYAGSPGDPVEISFGFQPDPARHPVLSQRCFFHFPERELFMTAVFPRPVRNWKTLTLMLDLDRDWPENAVVNREMFQLFCTPMENLRADAARPLECTGRKERHLLAHPDPDGHYRIQEICGVFQVGPDGTSPMFPGVISGQNGSYEILQDASPAEDRRSWIRLTHPSAFEKPVTVSVEALWHQPHLARHLTPNLRTRPFHREILGLEWELSGRVAPPFDTRFHEEIDRFLALFALKNRNTIDLEELVRLLSCMGTVWSGPFAGLKEILTGLKATETWGKTPGINYTVIFSSEEPDLESLAQCFTTHVQSLLDAWFSGPCITADICLRRPSRGALRGPSGGPAGG